MEFPKFNIKEKINHIKNIKNNENIEKQKQNNEDDKIYCDHVQKTLSQCFDKMMNNNDYINSVSSYFPSQRNPHKFNFKQCNFYDDIEKQAKNNGFKIIEKTNYFKSYTQYYENKITCEYDLNKQNIIIDVSVKPW